MGLPLVPVGVPHPLLPTIFDVDENHTPALEIAEKAKALALQNLFSVNKPVVVEVVGGEIPDQGGHAVLYVEEVGLGACVDQPFEEGPVEEGVVSVGAETGGGQLARVPYQQHLLNPRLKTYQQVGLCRLGSLVHN